MLFTTWAELAKSVEGWSYLASVWAFPQESISKDPATSLVTRNAP